jgi:hypothetical protein
MRDLQYYATKHQTYSVSGLLMDRNGKVIFADINRVICKLSNDEYFFKNPVNHGETQLIKWYW